MDHLRNSWTNGGKKASAKNPQYRILNRKFQRECERPMSYCWKIGVKKLKSHNNLGRSKLMHDEIKKWTGKKRANKLSSSIKDKNGKLLNDKVKVWIGGKNILANYLTTPDQICLRVITWRPTNNKNRGWKGTPQNEKWQSSRWSWDHSRNAKNLRWFWNRKIDSPLYQHLRYWFSTGRDAVINIHHTT